MLDCQNSGESEEIFRFDDLEDFLHQKRHHSKSCCTGATVMKTSNKDANGNHFNFDTEEILRIQPQKNFSFDIMTGVEKGTRGGFSRTTRCFDLSSMAQSLSSEEGSFDDEFELYDYSSSFDDMTIEGLRVHLRSCFTCGVHWHEEQASLDCTECGGYALTRPCLECEGNCRATWTRNLDQSHSLGKARWTGTCRKSHGVSKKI